MLLPKLVAVLGRTASRVTLRVVPITGRFPWTELENAELDLAIGRAPNMPARLRRRSLFTDRIVCMVRRELPQLDLATYLSLNHIDALPIEAPGLADLYLERIGKRRHVSVTVPHFLVAPHVVAQTDCCFTLSRRLALPLAKQVRAKIYELPFPAPEFSVHAYWDERMHADTGHRWLRGMLSRVLR